MSAAKQLSPDSHVVDILGSTRGRDQPIMLVEKALQLVSCIDKATILDPRTVYLDPFCKAGEILLAMAMHACATKNNREHILASKDEIVEELYKGQYFAMGPDERHFLLSTRTFYGNERSHSSEIAKHIVNADYLSEIDGRLNHEKFKKEFKSMIDFIKRSNADSKIVAVGNPPYQEADGGAQASAKPIYNIFVEALMDSEHIHEFALVIPARWFAAGKGLDDFRNRMTTCGQIKSLTYFQRAEDIFPTVHLQGGACFLHYKKDFKGSVTFRAKEHSSEIDLTKYDIIPDDPGCYSILTKINEKWKGPFVSSRAWPRKPFGLATNFFSQHAPVPENSANALKCYTKGKKIKYLNRNKVARNEDKIGHWKVAIPRVYGLSGRCTLPPKVFFLIEPDAVSTESYNVVDSFKTKAEAQRFMTFITTDFARYLLGLRKITQDIPKDRWDWVPYVDLSKEWTDEKLFEFFKLSRQEQMHIKKKVQEWS